MRLSTGVETGHFTQNRCSGHDRFSIYMIGLHIIRRSSKIWAPLGGSDAHDFRYCGGSNRLARPRRDWRNNCRCRESSQESLANISNGLSFSGIIALDSSTDVGHLAQISTAFDSLHIRSFVKISPAATWRIRAAHSHAAKQLTCSSAE